MGPPHSKILLFLVRTTKYGERGPPFLHPLKQWSSADGFICANRVGIRYHLAMNLYDISWMDELIEDEYVL